MDIGIQSSVAESVDLTIPMSYARWCELLNTPECLYSDSKLRSKYIAECGFPIITTETLDVLVRGLRKRKVADLGCGTGFLAHLLQSRGIDVVPIDNYSTEYLCGRLVARHCEVLMQDVHTVDLGPFDVLIMSWPDHRIDFASRVADAMHVGQYLLYQGDTQHGCTGDSKFFDILSADFKEYNSAYTKLNANHLTFDGIHDRWHVFKKIA